MKAFDEFLDKDPSFWSFVKFASENLGYTKRKQDIVKSYTASDIRDLCNSHNVIIDDQKINDAALYSKMRADLLNSYVKNQLMDADSARFEFEKLYPVYLDKKLKCSLPFNKQKGEMKQIAFFTSIINIITELAIRDITGVLTEKGFDDDPRGLIYIWDDNKNIIGSSSRRFDGAFPTINNPSIVWEIKEYYYTTTFGSKISDGVYETQLDGFEFKTLYERTGKKVFHVLFIDAYNTWWNKGKSYLCRIIDALNFGLVDEVIVGREVLTRWSDLLHSLI